MKDSELDPYIIIVKNTHSEMQGNQQRNMSKSLVKIIFLKGSVMFMLFVSCLKICNLL